MPPSACTLLIKNCLNNRENQTMKHVGIVGCSAEGAALCYRTIISEGIKRSGGLSHPEVSMHTPPLSDYMDLLNRDEPDWVAAGEVMLRSIEILKTAGADFAICPDNTIHEGFNMVRERSALPYLSILEVVADTAIARGMKKLLILGTTFTMTGNFYPEILSQKGLQHQSPDPEEQERVDSILWQELLHGSASPKSVAYYEGVIERHKSLGCDGVILGCTEIPIIISDQNSALRVLDSTRLLANTALDYAGA